jgi:hypothetical protein
VGVQQPQPRPEPDGSEIEYLEQGESGEEDERQERVEVVRSSEPGSGGRVGRELSAREIRRSRERSLERDPVDPEEDGRERNRHVHLHVVGIIESRSKGQVRDVEEVEEGKRDGDESFEPARGGVRREVVPGPETNYTDPETDEGSQSGGEVIESFGPGVVASVEDRTRDPSVQPAQRVDQVDFGEFTPFYCSRSSSSSRD